MTDFVRLIFGSGENCADLLYATNFPAPDPFFWFADSHGRKGVIVNSLEYDRAKMMIPADTMLLLDRELTENRGYFAQIKALAEKYHYRHFLVPGDFPLLLAEMLRQQGFSVVPEEKAFFPEREFKTQAEIDKIRSAQRAAEAGYLRAVDILAASSIADDGKILWQNEILTSEILRAEIDSTLLRNGARPTGTIAAGGPQSACPHLAGSGPLYQNSPIVMDIFPRMEATGYWGDLSRTVVKGKAPDIVKKAFYTIKEARDRAKDAICTGAIPSEIHLQVAQFLTDSGFPTGQDDQQRWHGFFHGLGHGVGLEIHEAPRVNATNSTPFKGNEVVTVEPGVYHPDWGGVRLEDLIVVQEQGFELLTAVPDQLEIA